MKTIAIALFGMLSSVSMASAGCNTQHLGQFSYTNCSDGSHYSSQRLGDFEYHNGRDAYGNYRSGTTQHLGNFEYHNGSIFDDD
jgi:hypothetical protein